MILAINTSTETFSVSLSDNHGNLLREISVRPAQGKHPAHSELIIKKTAELLKGKKPAGSNIEKAACAIGPGSFTGIRIGMTFARCLCQYNSIPLAGIKTHTALAHRVNLFLRKPLYYKEGRLLVCPVIPASMNEIYVSLFSIRHWRTSAQSRRSPREIFPCRILSMENLKKYLLNVKKQKSGQPLILTGGWTLKNNEFLRNSGINENEIFENDSMPSIAAAVSSLAASVKGQNYSKVTPSYLQMPRLHGSS